MLLRSIGLAAAAFLSSFGVQAAYSSSAPNVMYYWGQNSAGGLSTQSSLATYCQSGQADAVLLSFLHIFNVGGLPGLNFASACETYFEGTSTLNCPQIGADIKTCQSLGVKVILSLGGAAGSYGFTSDAQGQTFAQTIYDMFGPGSATYRPFGDAKIDGVDLDIEGGSSTGYAAFVTAVRSKFPSGFLVGAAPQCPFPDAILGSVINAVGFDYINVQFYNNYCSAAGGSFNFDTWASWATGTSPNKNVKIMFTIPGSTTAAGSGYVPISTLQTIVPQLASTYPGVYGGVSIWDASQAWANSGFASSIYSLVKGSGGGSTTTKTTTTTTKASTTTVAPTTVSSTKTTTTTTKTTTTTASTATATSGTCVAAGAACSTNGQYVCTSGGAYAVCDHNKWSVTSCPSGTVCIATTDGSSVYCGFATGSQTCSALNARALFRAILNRGGAIPKPYKGGSVIADFTVDSATATDFEAIVNARRTNASPFGKSVTIEFTAPSNVKYTEVDSGSIRQVGNKVRIQAKNYYNESMAIVVDVKGTVSSGIFVAPNPASIRIK